MIDPIVEETRRAGEKLFARHGNDMHKVVEYLRKRAREEGREIVALPPKPPREWVLARMKRAKKAG